ncbi:hypothetical protein ARMSODRAFT_1011186 [Armillaria solidipes]|uniref:DUF6535 domain-containing protein n=1 Tax=Armillaria solidipes TaxID=1076256 RepID=A0A2H3CR75_9AGAR|nr:hypothetical protein ARMSODRAFT_1011186 [Armillaria solidipes]
MKTGFVFDSTYDFKQKRPPDAVGEEMAPNAIFWRTYNDEAAVSDAEVMEQYRDTIDILLVFAGLFSAVVTAFVVQASESLKPDFAQISIGYPPRFCHGNLRKR